MSTTWLASPSCASCWAVSSMAEKQNTPEIRFEGFTDPWEQRKLGNCGTTYGGLTGKTKEDFGHGSAKFVPYTNVFDNPLTDTKRLEAVEIDSSQNQVAYGDVFFTVSSETPDEVGMSSVWLSDQEDVYLNSFCFGYRQDSTFDPHYLAYMLRSSSVRSNLTLLAQGISRFNISKNKVMELSVPVPSAIEQKQLGQYFTKLDDLITLHQRKYDKLCTVKKSMLDKMFPKPGETEPEIRFGGFTDPWEQRKFSDLTDRVSIQSSDSDLPQVEYEDIVSGEGTLNKDLRDKEGGKTGIKFYAGDVLYGKLRPYLMNWLYPQFNGVAVGDFWVLRATECDSSFLYRLIQTNNFQRLANVSSGSKMPRADWNLISQSFFAVPVDHAEQKAIAKSLAELDNLITLHQRKLELLRNIKKSLLDRMFV